MGVTVFVFSEREAENYSFLQAFVCVSFASPTAAPNRCSQKTVPRIFLKTARTLLILELRKKKKGGVIVVVFLPPSLIQLPHVPNNAISNNPGRYKTVESNGLAMAQSVEL